MRKIIGPFSELIDMAGLPIKGSIRAEQLTIGKQQGVLIHNGSIEAIMNFEALVKALPSVELEEIETPMVLLPGFIDCHTHLCWDGSRANDFAERLEGKSYLEITEAGGGIWSTVQKTRNASSQALIDGIVQRSIIHLKNGITTIEVKSGYGLAIEEELKILKAIKVANQLSPADLISTCLAAHMTPKDFNGSNNEYLDHLANNLLPKIKQQQLSNRIDIFIEKSAFSPAEGKAYLKQAKLQGFQITVHGDQFSVGGSKVAVQASALSVDHLEASRSKEIAMIVASDTIAVALPGASIGLGMEFTPARRILDQGGTLAIASDWNPGSAPMGDLLTEACILTTYEKLSIAETLAGITYRAAAALDLHNVGSIEKNKLADFQAYAVDDYREVFYQQGSLKPAAIWKKGIRI